MSTTNSYNQLVFALSSLISKRKNSQMFFQLLNGGNKGETII